MARNSKYPNLTPAERRKLYNKQFRERKKQDPEYQAKLAEYRREQLRKSYYKLKEQDPRGFEEYMKKHSQYSLSSRKRAIDRGEGEKYKIADKLYYEQNKEKYLRSSANRRKLMRNTTPENYISYLIQSARSRSNRLGIECTITSDDLSMPSVCPILNIPIITTSTKQIDNSPSIDRIDSTRGYIPGNVHIISWRANTLKKDATPYELQLLSEYFNKC